jgi:hypothetical protein
MVSQFFKAIATDAWSRTDQRFRDTWQGWLLAASAFVVGVIYHALFADWSQALENAIVSLLTGLCGTFTMVFLILVWNLGAAPYRLWDADQRRLARQSAASNHRAVADQLKEHCLNGQRLLQRWSGDTFNNEVRSWQKSAEGIVEKCGPEELAMFQTLYPPFVRGALYTPEYRQRDKSRLKGMIEKLRYIMARQYQAEAAKT